MNLIEQLGGYKNTAKFCDKEIKHGFYPYDLVQALLNYRRENNIFEKGDLVVFKNNWTANNSVLMVDGDSKNSIRLDTVLDLNSHFRHATQKEIAQGYRDE